MSVFLSVPYMSLVACSLSMSRSRENGEEIDGERTKRQKLELEGESEDATQVRSPRPEVDRSLCNDLPHSHGR